MNAQTQIEKPDSAASLDHVLHGVLSDVSPATLAAMRALVYQVEVTDVQKSQVSSDDLIAACGQLDVAHTAMKDLQTKRLDPLDIVLPEDVRKQAESLTQALSELTLIMSRCAVDEEGYIKGFRAGPNMYDLCCTRVAQGIDAFCAALGAVFLEVTDKSKAEELDKTATIATEIGKIGRVINMVATNASIEAARVGDAGKGFTVIADEVKVLSTRVSSLSVSLTDRLN